MERGREDQSPDEELQDDELEEEKLFLHELEEAAQGLILQNDPFHPPSAGSLIVLLPLYPVATLPPNGAEQLMNS